MAYVILDSCIGCGSCYDICPSQAVTGKKKKPHKIDATICIDCGACGRVCPVNAVEDNFGIIVQWVKKEDWDTPVFDLYVCMSCNICLDTCPAGALDECLQKKGSRHPFPCLSNESDCMGCGFCAADCPVNAITMTRIRVQTPGPVLASAPGA